MPFSRLMYLVKQLFIGCLEVRAARYGRKNADYYFRSVGKGITAKHILERVEVDHTPLDIMVVNEETGIVEGRPYLTCLLDVKSRMPLDMEIGFEPPSVLSVMKALKQAIWFKDWINEAYPTIKIYGLLMVFLTR
ncbi:hypothetical protein DM558_12265 [Entomomonas moraniae]|uniref:Uncharacterized protein n=1 Tax=Entomomonas moraniae TaxID=2213226 RepID=A0A451ENY7_9GAMM|nr:hypothetical protein [Entomomonas moraniae]AZS51495.1 hypothetical protein DM558_12265 [Entomomonas moraniae]